jgi:hypothetical protein
MSEPADGDGPWLRRKTGVAELQAEGYPLSLSEFNKICMRGEGPPVDAMWGKTELRKPQTFKNWALSRLKPGNNKAA